MFNKYIIGAAVCLLLAVGTDYLSTSSSSENSISKLKFYVFDLFDDSIKKIQNPKFKEAVSRINPSLEDLKTIEQYIDEFECNRLSLHIYKNGKEVFWTNQQGFKDVCIDSIVADYQIKMCTNLFDSDGKLHKNISSSFGNFHEFSLADKGNNSIDFGQGRLSVELGNTIRAWWLQAIILLLFLVGFWLLIAGLNKNGVNVLLILIFLRLIFYILPLDTHFNPSKIFSQEHGFSILNESIAGYLFNTLILLIASISFSKYILKKSEWFTSSQKRKIIAGIIVGLVFTLIYIFNTQCLIYFSNLNFDFEDLSKLGVLEQISLAALSINGLSLFIFNQSIYNQITSHVNLVKNRYPLYLIAVLIISVFSLFLNLEIPFFWILSFFSVLLILFDLFSDFKSKNITWLIWWMIVFSIFISAILYHFDMRKDIQDRSVFLDQLYHQIDTSQYEIFQSEFDNIKNGGYLDEIIDKPSQDKFNTYDIIEYIKYKLPSVEQYELALLVFDSLGNPLALNQYNNKESFKTKNIHKIEIDNGWTFNPLSNQYWVEQSMTRNDENLSIYFGFNSPSDLKDNPKKYPYSVFTENTILVDQNNLDAEEQALILNKSTESELIFKGPNAYIVSVPNAKTVLASKKTFASIIKPVALFSLIFTIFGVILLLLALINGYLSFLPASLPLKFWDINSFSIRIQLVIIILIIISFLGIAWVTVRFVNDFINNNENQLIEAKISSISKNMNLRIREEQDFNTALEIISGTKNQFESIHQSDVAIYSIEGKPYEKEEIEKIDFLAYYYFNRLNGKFPFTIRKQTTDPKSYFILNHQSQNEAIVSLGSNAEVKASKLSIFDFLGSIVNVYVFLFLIAGAISIAVARSISRPLSVLGEKMQQLKFGSKNERLEWNSDDEIGALIENYNGMLIQLEESAEVLAKTERDMAWREMAKQVAHEIKNPLTPMKLSIQYLEKAMKSNSGDVKPLIKRISETLLLQINNLSEIADSFSNFAQLPQANNEKISLNEVVETIHDLFRKREDLNIKLIEPIDSVLVYADKNHLVRILNNLVKNAIEAIPESKQGEITIVLSKNDRNATIKVSDNGTGIPKELHKKVFTPNFTTKNSGSGLGLAIASNMLDAFNARIYFETEEGIGTDFFIEIPLIRSGGSENKGQRVGLDA